MTDYKNIIKAATNKSCNRIPLYDHVIKPVVIEKIKNIKFAQLIDGNDRDIKEYMSTIVNFYREFGYDTVSFEMIFRYGMPGAGSLSSQKPGVIKTTEDFNRYPWEDLPQIYFRKTERYFDALLQVMPQDMRAIGGIGMGVFESVQDLVGFMDLCYMSSDDPELYKNIFNNVGEALCKAWTLLLDRFSDLFAVCRFGDDLGFNTSTLIPQNDIRLHIIPHYNKIISVVHSYNKPFLLHSCGNIFDVMNDIIDIAKIDAKHSNEDSIAPFVNWIDLYGDKIGNFGGVDTDIISRHSEVDIKKMVYEIFEYAVKTKGKSGFAFGTGNSVPDYTLPEAFIAMNEAARECREKY